MTNADDMYQENILDHYRHPHNFGQMERPDVDVNDYNPLCGDKIGIQLKIEHGKISDIRFYGSGCAISQAAASMLTDEVKGKIIEDALKIDKHAVLALLGIPISYTRLKCALLSLKALKMALYSYQGKKFDLSEKEFG